MENKRECKFCGCTDDKPCITSGDPCDLIPTIGNMHVCSNAACVRSYHETTAHLLSPEVPHTTVGDQIVMFISGKPKQSGSKTAMPIMRKGLPVLGRNGAPIINVIDDATLSQKGKAEVKLWRKTVAETARLVCGPGFKPIETPVTVAARFLLERPAGHYGTGKNEGKLKPSAPLFPGVKPDATKLFRLLEDCLTGIVWRDDNLVIDELIRKRYADRGHTGAVVIVQPVKG